MGRALVSLGTYPRVQQSDSRQTVGRNAYTTPSAADIRAQGGQPCSSIRRHSHNRWNRDVENTDRHPRGPVNEKAKEEKNNAMFRFQKMFSGVSDKRSFLKEIPVTGLKMFLRNAKSKCIVF